MFDFSVSSQTALSILTIILLLWVLLSVQGLGDRILVLDARLSKSLKSSSPSSSINTTPILNLDDMSQIHMMEPYSNSPSSFRILETPYNPPSHMHSAPPGLEFNFEGKGWTGMAMPRNSQFAEFM